MLEPARAISLQAIRIFNVILSAGRFYIIYGKEIPKTRKTL